MLPLGEAEPRVQVIYCPPRPPPPPTVPPSPCEPPPCLARLHELISDSANSLTCRRLAADIIPPPSLGTRNRRADKIRGKKKRGHEVSFPLYGPPPPSRPPSPVPLTHRGLLIPREEISDGSAIARPVARPVAQRLSCGGRWFDPRRGHEEICTAVGPLSKALNPTLLQSGLSPA